VRLQYHERNIKGDTVEEIAGGSRIELKSADAVQWLYPSAGPKIGPGLPL